eukprot:TRINITY_DN15479_c0_g1_i3.p1 TRINITY_DN15479_c0_g1~~TRINITY_DN15479_c0_g1_i3.p1  ORF type:complete len:325 (+),score=90.48 TRINITY_DN15479_c0_g1_i3:50-976(+)
MAGGILLPLAALLAAAAPLPGCRPGRQDLAALRCGLVDSWDCAPNSTDCGLLFVAMRSDGQRRKYGSDPGLAFYAAAESARKIRRTLRGFPIAVVTNVDADRARRLAGFEPSPFDIVVSKPGAPFVSKIDALAHTPFRRTMFVDFDIVPADKRPPTASLFANVFSLLKYHDFLAATEGSWDHPQWRHLVKEKITEQMYNSGVILYRTTSACIPSFLRCWTDEYMRRCHGREDQAFWDQCALHHALRLHPVKYSTLSSKLNWRNAFMPNRGPDGLPEHTKVVLNHDKKTAHMDETMAKYPSAPRDVRSV